VGLWLADYVLGSGEIDDSTPVQFHQRQLLEVDALNWRNLTTVSSLVDLNQASQLLSAGTVYFPVNAQQFMRTLCLGARAEWDWVDPKPRVPKGDSVANS
jgi:hypothetical protein